MGGQKLSQSLGKFVFGGHLATLCFLPQDIPESLMLRNFNKEYT